MTKVRKINVSRFRGARFDLSLDFSKKPKSVAIFGDNASGKSTITDALEWFIYDRVNHLWREDCKLDALRNVLADGKPSCVELEFAGKDLHGVKELSEALKTSANYAKDDAEKLVSALKDDRIILRHADIVNFLDETKSVKRKTIAEIIGYGEITKFRDALLQARNSLDKEPEYTSAKQHIQRLQSAMIAEVGQVVPNRKEFRVVASNIMEPFDLAVEVTDEQSFAEALDELRGQGSSEDNIRLAERLAHLEKACSDLVRDIDQLSQDAAAFIVKYNALVKEGESVNKLRLSDFLTRGKAVLDDKVFTDPQCPFCLEPFELAQLQAEVGKRLEALKALQEQLDEAGTLKDVLAETVTNAGIKTKTIQETYSDLENFSSLIAAAKSARPKLRDYLKDLKSAFDGKKHFEGPGGFDADLKTLRTETEKAAKKANEAAQKLKLTELEKKVAAALTRLTAVSDQVNELERYQSIGKAYEVQIITLSSMLDAFIKVQNAALQAVLDTISDDVGKFYKALHPKESVDNVRLTMVGDEGVEFQYTFHGKPTQPPRKFLSESHLNSLGVVLFLANARIFNTHANFLVLDDIVTSFDISHRRRLLRLLRDEFSNWQIIILTHENIWFDIIKKEMAEQGWVFHEIRSDDANGILLENSPSTLKQIIEEKKGKEDVTNDLRKLLELVLKGICQALEVKVAFRFNDINEKRMSDELINALRSTLKAKSPDLLDTKIFSELAGSTLIANLVSHDNADSIVGEDIDVMLEDIEKLVALFVCEHCDRHIRAAVSVPGEKAISCRCGKTKIPWKT
ncbi:AAA family ATPase [Hyphobacterium sp.]|uniref:AAA family ATPase n=1 Tax=Hyphobacterium sp. TaxID=2004662 RepID=UPI001DBE973F|nr:AAA family ATPase [Alphaproteobacteria bacterium]